MAATPSWTVQVATRAPGASGFSAPVEAAPPGDNVSEVVLVVDDTGATTVAWSRSRATESWAEVARRSPGALAFTVPTSLGGLESGAGDLVGVGDRAGPGDPGVGHARTAGRQLHPHPDPLVYLGADPGGLGNPGCPRFGRPRASGLGGRRCRSRDRGLDRLLRRRLRHDPDPARRRHRHSGRRRRSPLPATSPRRLIIASNPAGDTVLVLVARGRQRLCRRRGATGKPEPPRSGGPIVAVTTADFVEPNGRRSTARGPSRSPGRSSPTCRGSGQPRRRAAAPSPRRSRWPPGDSSRPGLH